MLWYSHHHTPLPGLFHHSKQEICPLNKQTNKQANKQKSPFPLPSASDHLYSPFCLYEFSYSWYLIRSRIMWYLSYCVCWIRVSWRFIDVVICIRISFIFCPNNIPLYVSLIHLSVGRHLSCFCLLAAGNNVAMNISVQVNPLLEGSSPPLQPWSPDTQLSGGTASNKQKRTPVAAGKWLKFWLEVL